MMITYKDIKKAINAKIDANFDAEINSQDVKEGFNRPSFFVQIINAVSSGDASQKYKSMTIEIYYFPSDRYKYSIEALEVQEQLESIFDLKLKVHNRYFNIDETEADITDGVLNFSFDIAFYDGREYEGLEDVWIDEEFPELNLDGTPKQGEDFHEKHPVEKMEELEIDKE